MSGPTGSGQRYLADQLLTLNEDCAFVGHDDWNPTILRGPFFSTTGEEPGGPAEPDYCAGGVAMTGVFFEGGDTLIRYPSVLLTNFTVQKLPNNLQTRE